MAARATTTSSTSISMEGSHGTMDGPSPPAAAAHWLQTATRAAQTLLTAGRRHNNKTQEIRTSGQAFLTRT